jgi:hypothetical protein
MIKATIHCPIYNEKIMLVTHCNIKQFINTIVKDLQAALKSKIMKPTEECRRGISEEILEIKELPKTTSEASGLTVVRNYHSMAYVWIADNAGALDTFNNDGTNAWQIGFEEDADAGGRIAKLGVLIHELNHVAIHILSKHGIPIDGDNEEACCYYVQWLFKALSFESIKFEKNFRLLEK